MPQDFPGSPVVKTPTSTVGGTGLIPGPEIKVMHATWYNQKKVNIMPNSPPHQEKSFLCLIVLIIF